MHTIESLRFRGFRQQRLKYKYDIEICLRNLLRYEEAIQMDDKRIQLNPLYSNAYFYKG